MAVLSRALALVALASCYSPDLRDCTVSCASSSDCAGAQVCGADHFCALPAVAGSCGHPQGLPDGGPGDAAADGPVDARVTPPADAAPDAPQTAGLHLKVGGHGQLAAGTNTCTMDCTYQLPLVPIDVVATGAGDQVFEKWTEGPCMGMQTTTCTVTPPATVGVKFHKVDQ
jgi:hypothetical protein